MNDHRRLIGKRVLITGTGSGQGAAAQRRFCEEGASVIGCDVRAGSAESHAESLRAEGFEAYGLTADVADPEAAKAWVEWGVEQLGGLDVLYNNASAADFAPFEEMTGAIWEFSMRNELDLVFYVTLAAWRHLQRGGGSIINVGSASALVADATLGQSAHTVTKAGVIALTRQLAAEGGPHAIRVNAISPGYIQTPATSDHPGALRRSWISSSSSDWARRRTSSPWPSTSRQTRAASRRARTSSSTGAGLSAPRIPTSTSTRLTPPFDAVMPAGGSAPDGFRLRGPGAAPRPGTVLYAPPVAVSRG